MLVLHTVRVITDSGLKKIWKLHSKPIMNLTMMPKNDIRSLSIQVMISQWFIGVSFCNTLKHKGSFFYIVLDEKPLGAYPRGFCVWSVI